MMKINSKLILEVIIIMALLLAIGTVVFAADPIIIGGGSANTQNDTSNVQNEVPNVISNQTSNTTNTTNTTSYRTNNTTNTQTLPKTGVTDGYVVAILVTVCAISAIYAYKKIRDYNA